MVCNPAPEQEPVERFDIRPDGKGGTWMVFDARTSKVAKLNDTPQRGFSIEDAAEVAELLTRRLPFQLRVRR